MFDTSEEVVILNWRSEEAVVRRGNQIFYISKEKIDENKNIGDEVNLTHFDYICGGCSSEKMYDEKNQVYYCPKCEQ